MLRAGVGIAKKLLLICGPVLVIRCLPAYLLETSPSYFSIPFCASQKPYQTALSYLSYLSHLFILVMCFKCFFFLAVNLCVRHGREIVENAPWFARPLRTCINDNY